MNDERVEEIRAEFGLTEQQAAPRYVRVLLHRLAQAEREVVMAGSDVADRAQMGVDNATTRTTWTSAGGTPLHAAVELAGRYDCALVRLAERQAALALVAEEITASH
jgi:hypothetical protein